MSPEQKQLVRLSWLDVAPSADDFALLFYHRLFAIAPASQALFASVDPVAQRSKLLAAISTVVDGLDGFDGLSRVLAELGTRHASYGVEDGQYDSVGAAFLWALERITDQPWTRELNDAWSSAYGAVSQVMRAAGRAAHPNIGGNPSDQSNRPIRKSQEEA